MDKQLTKKYGIILGIVVMIFVQIICLLAFAPQKNAYASSGVWQGDIASSFDGDGTVLNPYKIDSGAELFLLSQNVGAGQSYLGDYFEVTNDIVLNDLTSYNDWHIQSPDNVWEPIGIFDIDSGIAHAFSGTIIGNDKTISGLFCDSQSGGGLFGYLSSTNISSLNIDYALIISGGESAVLASFVEDSTIDGCLVTNSKVLSQQFEQSGEYLGGIVARLDNSTVSNCMFVGQIFGYKNLGGIVGENNGDIVDCFSDSYIVGQSIIGGIAGINDSSGTISNSFSLSQIECTDIDANFGAIAGGNYGQVLDVFYHKNESMPYDFGGSEQDEWGRDLLDIVGLSLQESLSNNWTFTENLFDTYYYPQLTKFYNQNNYNFVAYIINLYQNEQLYQQILGKQGQNITLPVIAKDGYNVSWHQQSGGVYGESLTQIVAVSTTNLYAISTLNPPIILQQSEDIDIIFDGVGYYLAVDATVENLDIMLNYSWYFSNQIDGEYVLIDGDTSSFLVKNHSDSGFYKCGVWASFDGDISSIEFSQPFGVNIQKATISTQDIPIFSGIYDSENTLSSYDLPPNFYWLDGSIVPTCDIEFYSGFYNIDLDNYHNYAVEIQIVLYKADYQDITHSILSGVFSPMQTLQDFALSTGFAWQNSQIIPTVNTTLYTAIYNLDSINYNDFVLDITINLGKASYEGIAHTAIYGTYDATKTLSSYALSSANYWWKDNSEVPTVLKNNYSAFYNGDKDNYNDYEFLIALYLNKYKPNVVVDFDSTTKLFLGDSLPIISMVSSDIVGSLSWDSYQLSLGENTCFWSFVPLDLDNYKVVRESVVFIIYEVEVDFIEVTQQPLKTHYEALSQFDGDGLILQAVFNNGDTQIVTNYIIEYISGQSVVFGDTFVTAKYVENDINFYVEIAITVQKIVINTPTIDANFYYNGSEQTHNIANSDYYTVDQTMYKNANTYYIEVALVDAINYCFEDGFSQNKMIEWAILPLAVDKPSIVGEYVYSGMLQQANIATSDAYLIINNKQKDTGTYNVLLELIDKNNYQWSGGGTDNVELSWTINKYIVPSPVYIESNFVYNKTYQRANISTSIFYYIDNDYHKNAGNYVAEVMLLDTVNYCFEDGSNDIKHFPFSIAKQVVALPYLTTQQYVYSGNIQKAQINENSAYSIVNNQHKDAGTYIISISIDGQNYSWADGEESDKTLTFVIEKLSVQIPTLVGNYVYSGEEQQLQIEDGRYQILSGDTFVSAGSHTLSLQLTDSDNTKWADGLGGVNRLIEYFVHQKELAIITIDSKDFVYSGQLITYSLNIDNFIFNIENNQKTEVGNYQLKLSIKNSNYKWQDSGIEYITANWRILPQVVAKVQKSNVDIFYMAAQQYAPIAESTKYSITGNIATNVGTYTATISLIDKNNYVWSDDTTASYTISWSIKKAKVDKPTAKDNLIYNGMQQTYNIAENPVYTITNNKATVGGKYTAKVMLNDTDNYQWSDGSVQAVEFVWHIFYIKTTIDGVEQTITAMGGSSVLFTPQKDGYVFEGWYLDSDFSGQKITELVDIDADTILYAKWRQANDYVDQGEVKQPNGLSSKAKIGLIVGGVLSLLAVALIIFALFKRK